MSGRGISEVCQAPKDYSSCPIWFWKTWVSCILYMSPTIARNMPELNIQDYTSGAFNLLCYIFKWSLTRAMRLNASASWVKGDVFPNQNLAVVTFPTALTLLSFIFSSPLPWLSLPNLLFESTFPIFPLTLFFLLTFFCLCSGPQSRGRFHQTCDSYS